tara:strand:- start:1357 stop:1551 length:195 start_codon:yes stop_codon:yes gene_type:complete
MVDDATASCWLRRRVHRSHDSLSRLREQGLLLDVECSEDIKVLMHVLDKIQNKIMADKYPAHNL